MMSLEWWASYLTRNVHSEVTGWHQVLYWCKSPQSEISIVKIVYYSTALSALTDNSIFPANSIVQFF